MEIVKLTAAAQDKARELLVRKQSERPEDGLDGLRIAVVGGGCSGLQYQLGFDQSREADLTLIYDNGLLVMVDPKSANLLAGSSMDYHDDLTQAGFEITNPNSTGGCGCGKSFAG